MFPKRLITLCLSFCLFLLVKTSYSQITVTANNLSPYYQIGNVITQKFDTLSETAMLNIGMPGGGNTWDFSSVPLSTISQQQMVLDPANTPGAASFASANVSLFFEFSDEDGETDAYNYLNFTTEGIDFLGTYGITEADGEALTSTITYNPAELVLPLPVTFNDTWSYQGKQSINSTFDGMNFPLSEDDVSNSYKVDAYGNITLPDGRTEAALRIRQLSVSEIELIPGFAFVDSTLSFFFLTQSGATVNIDAEDANAPDQGMILGSLTWSTFSGVSSANNLEAQGYELLEVAPNPVKQHTMIDYTLPDATSIQLSLFDQTGKLVNTLFNGRQVAGSHRIEWSVEGLANGQYYLSLIVQRGVLTKTLIVQN